MNRRRLIAALALVFAVNISLIALAQQAQAVTFRQGSSGEQVRIIQTKLNSYVAGEDGKEGIKGRLVSKQGQLIARTMVAGFLSGMSEAFDYTPVSVLSTTTTGTVQYQENFSSEAAKSGFAEGLKNSLDRVADFYMDLADEMVPVVEINAGRQVDIIVISGTTLNVTAKNQVDLNSINKTASQGR